MESVDVSHPNVQHLLLNLILTSDSSYSEGNRDDIFHKRKDSHKSIDYNHIVLKKPGEGF